MANKTITMLQIRRVLQLLQQGASHRKIAREVSISRNTVQDYSLRFIRSGHTYLELLALSDGDLSDLILTKRSTPLKDSRYERLAPRLPDTLKELNRTGVTRMLLWKEYCRDDADPYSYQQFCHHLGTHQLMNEAVMHFDHTAGEKVEIDFAGKKMHYIDKQTGEVIECPVLVAVLLHSGYTYVEALPSASMVHVVDFLNSCMEYFGGVPAYVVSDNMKQTVKSANRYEPSFTDLINQWSVHYNTTFLATRVRKPRDKATVEKAVDLAYKRIYAPLRDHSFYSLEALNQGILNCLKEHNHALKQRKEHSRYDLFVQEQQTLKSLPIQVFELKYSISAKVQRNYHVTLGQDWHHYSVPFKYIGKKVKLVYDTQVVEVYEGLNRIALHKRNYRKHGYSTVEEHMPERHQQYRQSLGWNVEYFLQKAETVGEHFKQAITQIINSRSFTEQTYNACLGLIRLKDKYGKERLEAAAKRALQGSSVSYRSISTILANGTDQQLHLSDVPIAIPLHDNIRGPENYN
jgi:transposase